MKISEIMIREVISVKEDAPISQVAELISKNRIHAVPVVDNGNKVVGIITETDFFGKDSDNMVYIPSLIDFVNRGKLDCSEKEMEEINKMMNFKARDIMSSKCENLRPEMELESFVKLIKEKSFNSYPVVEEDGTLCGIMTVVDAIKLL